MKGTVWDPKVFFYCVHYLECHLPEVPVELPIMDTLKSGQPLPLLSIHFYL